MVSEITYRSWPAPEHAGTVDGQVTCPDAASNRKMLELFLPILRERLLRPEFGGSMGIDGTGVSLGGLCYQGITERAAQLTLDAVAAAATSVNCTAAGVKATGVAQMTVAGGRLIARQFPEIDHGAYPDTGDAAVDSHWVIEAGNSYMLGYISRYVPLSLLQDVPKALAAFQTLIDAKVGVGIDLKKATGTLAGVSTPPRARDPQERLLFLGPKKCVLSRARIVNPYAKTFLGPDNILRGPNRARRAGKGYRVGPKVGPT